MIPLKNTDDYKKMTAPEGARGSGGAGTAEGGRAVGCPSVAVGLP